MASPDDAATHDLRDFTDVKVALVAGLCTVVLTLALKYGANVEVSLVYRLSPLAPYFAYVFSRGAALSARVWMALIAVVTLGTFGFFAF
ncbi:hypothetical protein E6P09_11640 [Haloferax mediterranei ATCC 33500]|uniref:DUF8049 domain-containing protein n=1 Tax=Haloferax mediterranei (strain ATCC 33500 / DSM 1411 / JCM 8866 / NBRC 14739 / NCIMB 2177 / R-4) TaxID=523841 RepID=I3R5B9_HALMT|nr:hypothetical protein [Haloferax mediterranei]AFK19429.1 hypothetical protein HFX_1723 [Haloferax mediterranei ATCC 33500]AHZ21220.1 hypothetical protein BM92_00490 [Haloferax mediterranei ATCC 33500]EMA04381.1 hypothetical protein C439_01862 [Haloferax mediterranei ATCC 33500]MDX5989534.1 hypothetical protein [Haloferax mediterranei ATCC 33500]QCQ75891.1 hypothetical protein E6P09_11640 [Haloferax mediterranei ATCC 33500]